MARTQKKSLLWRRFKYPALIDIDFGDFFPSCSIHFIISKRGFVKYSKEWFIRYPNISKSVEDIQLRLVFQPTFRGLEIPMKHSFSCFRYITPSVPVDLSCFHDYGQKL